MDARITELEIKISYMEDLLEELNQTVIRQQRQIEVLEAQARLLNQQLQTLTPDDKGDLREEVPPHY